MAYRTRSTGWQHAKLSGHTNEMLVKELLDNNLKYKNEFMSRLGLRGTTIQSTSIGGLHETNVPGILGKKTKSKTDLKLICSNEKNVNISIKKSLSRQVYFVKASLFINVFEKQFRKPIPSSVQRAIKLFWADADDALEIIHQFGDKTNPKNYYQQIRHKSLNATTLKNYNINLYNCMLRWFKDNIYELTKLSFAMGAARDTDEWSDYIWYINLLDEVAVDRLFCIKDLCQAAVYVADSETYYGSTNGGTTIQLPFGFVQWHQQQLQFHHSYKKISNLLNPM